MIESILEVACEAGKRILDIYNMDDFGVEAKADESPLTKADLAAHEHIVASLEALTPDIPVLSEESKGISYEDRKDWKTFWLVDPLDGTKEFIKRNGEFTVNIALIEDGQATMSVVHIPVENISYWGVKGEGAFKRENGTDIAIKSAANLVSPMRIVASRSHMGAETAAFLENLKQDHEVEIVSKGSSLKLCLLAEDKADLYPRLGPTMEWDTAAAQCIVEQAGGQVTTLEGEPLCYNKENLLNPFFMVSSAATTQLWKKHL